MSLTPPLPPALLAGLALLTGLLHAGLAVYALALLVRLRKILREPKTQMLASFTAIGAWNAFFYLADGLDGDGLSSATSHTVLSALTAGVLLRIVHRTAVSSRTWDASPV